MNLTKKQKNWIMIAVMLSAFIVFCSILIAFIMVLVGIIEG